MRNETNQSIPSIGLLLSRIILGVVLIAHGWQKFTEWGIDGTTQSFTEMGVPAAGLAAVVAAVIELVGGILMILGLGTRIVAAILVLEMIGAGIFAGHFASGVFIDNGGWELVGMIIATSLALLFAGPGQFAIDKLFNREPKSASVKATPAEATPTAK